MSLNMQLPTTVEPPAEAVPDGKPLLSTPVLAERSPTAVDTPESRLHLYKTVCTGTLWDLFATGLYTASTVERSEKRVSTCRDAFLIASFVFGFFTFVLVATLVCHQHRRITAPPHLTSWSLFVGSIFQLSSLIHPDEMGVWSPPDASDAVNTTIITLINGTEVISHAMIVPDEDKPTVDAELAYRLSPIVMAILLTVTVVIGRYYSAQQARFERISAQWNRLSASSDLLLREICNSVTSGRYDMSSKDVWARMERLFLDKIACDCVGNGVTIRSDFNAVFDTLPPQENERKIEINKVFLAAASPQFNIRVKPAAKTQHRSRRARRHSTPFSTDSVNWFVFLCIVMHS